MGNVLKNIPYRDLIGSPWIARLCESFDVTLPLPGRSDKLANLAPDCAADKIQRCHK